MDILKVFRTIFVESFNLGSLEDSSWWESSVCFLTRISQKWWCILPSAWYREYMICNYPIIGYLKFYHLDKLISVEILHCNYHFLLLLLVSYKDILWYDVNMLFLIILSLSSFTNPLVIVASSKYCSCVCQMVIFLFHYYFYIS